jgi:hypothetical protein
MEHRAGTVQRERRRVTKEKWYRDGLEFTCTQCGNCCSGPPGYVWVSREEERRIAEFLGGEGERLGPEQIRRAGFRQSLTERPNGDCIFLRREGGRTMCSIYPVRPTQCRTWPFWSENLRSADAWEQAQKRCPGMGRGQHYDFVQIEVLRRQRG